MKPENIRNIARQDQCEAAHDAWWRGLDDDTLTAYLETALAVDECEEPVIPTPLIRPALLALMLVATKELVRRLAEEKQ